MAVARSLGHGSRSSFLRIVLPQVLPRATWPIIAVFSYGLTVVDMALVIGPGQPPTLAQLVWTDLNDGDAAHAARGAAGTLLLSTGVIALLAACCVGVARGSTLYATMAHRCRIIGNSTPRNREMAVARLAGDLWPGDCRAGYAVDLPALALPAHPQQPHCRSRPGDNSCSMPPPC